MEIYASKLELKKISGDAIEFLGFWSKFSNIHEDLNIAAEYNFHYPTQCVIPNSRTAHLVSSFPLTAPNYLKVVKQLRDRFGRDDLLIQRYVLNFTSIVTKNATMEHTLLWISLFCVAA